MKVKTKKIKKMKKKAHQNLRHFMSGMNLRNVWILRNKVNNKTRSSRQTRSKPQKDYWQPLSQNFPT